MVKAMVLVHFYCSGGMSGGVFFRGHMLVPIHAPDWEALARMVNEDVKSWRDSTLLKPSLREIEEQFPRPRPYEVRIMQILPIANVLETIASPGQSCTGC